MEKTINSTTAEMELNTNKFWSRDFSLLIGGQFISIFGNMILSFALPLYLLYISGSATLFGLVMGLSSIPLLIMSPIGGMIADRFKKQRVMFWLDAGTTMLIVGYIAASGLTTAVAPIIVIKLMALNAIQGVYMPTANACVPFLASGKNLVSANSAVTSINTISGIGGMAIAGVLFARFGLMPILIVSAICFAITAIMDLVIRVPFKPQDNSVGIVKIVKGDLSQAFGFIKTQPLVKRSMALMFALSATIGSIFIIGAPVIITQYLDMGMHFVGISQSIILIGGLLGGIITGLLGSKLKNSSITIMIVTTGITIIPIGLALLLNAPYFVTYITMTASFLLAMAGIAALNIRILSMIQGATPTALMGKVVSIVAMLPFLGQAIGQLIYGVAFEQLSQAPFVIIFGTTGIIAVIALYSRRGFETCNNAKGTVLVAHG